MPGSRAGHLAISVNEDFEAKRNVENCFLVTLILSFKIPVELHYCLYALSEDFEIEILIR